MDWLQQTQDMMKVWMDTQQKMWGSWTTTAKELGEKPSAGAWDKTVQAWQNSFKNLIETQALWARMWARSISSSNDSEQTAAFVKGVEDMTNAWVQTQEMLWNNWFDMVRQLNPANMGDNMQDQTGKAIASWQEQMQKIMDAQNEWTKQWSTMMAKKDEDAE